MTAPDAPSPYRHDLDAAFTRIAELEAQLAGHRRAGVALEGIDANSQRALAALRVAHLREDRQALISRHQSVRRGTFAGTVVAMLGAFGFFVRAARLDPANATTTWALCGAVVSAVAAVGLLLQTALRARDLRRLRALERRIAEERVLAGVQSAERVRADEAREVELERARVRVAVSDPFAPAEGSEADPLAAPAPAHVTARR